MSKFRIAGVIPARLSSTRLSRKVLRVIAGRPMVEWVWRAAQASGLMDPVVVATDSDEVAAVCRERGIPVVMTSPTCPSGSDRVREVALQIDADIYVNIQGDEPTLTSSFFPPLLALFDRPEVAVSTLAVPCAAEGNDVKGKKVPHKKNIGVKNRNDGKLKKSIFGATEVKHMAMDANIKPPKNANGITSKNSGLEINPKAATTAKTMVVLIVALVAPQSNSPATTSSTLTGVATMASKVFWKYIRTKEANVHSKNEPFIIEIATNAGAMKLMYDWPLMLGMKPPSP